MAPLEILSYLSKFAGLELAKEEMLTFLQQSPQLSTQQAAFPLGSRRCDLKTSSEERSWLLPKQVPHTSPRRHCAGHGAQNGGRGLDGLPWGIHVQSRQSEADAIPIRLPGAPVTGTLPEIC